VSATTTTITDTRRALLTARGADYLELTKPRIAVLELVTLAVAALLAGIHDVWALAYALLGTALVAAGASAFNQWWERNSDQRMERTASRPLPAGRLTSLEVVVFGSVAAVAGVALLAVQVNPRTAVLGFLTWFLYVLVYTPMKSRTPMNTLVGAVAGALPILMGWTAMGAPLGLKAGTLFLILFLWQFPHFMAIAWIYRRQYGAAGMKMLTVVDPSGRRAGAQAVVVALVLIPVSLIPAVLPLSGSVFVDFAGALALGVGQLLCAVLFLMKLDDRSARRLLRASLIYLPALLMLLVLATPL
jgi:protoheme IX farnesyltransferase